MPSITTTEGVSPIDGCNQPIAEMKRRLRKLKRLEQKLRGATDPSTTAFVWDAFFARGRGLYPVEALAAMDRQTFKQVLDSFFSRLYYALYKERGLTAPQQFDPEMLSKLGLSYDADAQDIKRRFRALAKRAHPDAGGDEAAFIALMEIYEQLMDKGP